MKFVKREKIGDNLRKVSKLDPETDIKEKSFPSKILSTKKQVVWNTWIHQKSKGGYPNNQKKSIHKEQHKYYDI